VVSHEPPHGVLDTNYQGLSCGNKMIRRLVEAWESPPSLWVFGHIHEGYGAKRVRLKHRRRKRVQGMAAEKIGKEGAVAGGGEPAQRSPRDRGTRPLLFQVVTGGDEQNAISEFLESELSHAGAKVGAGEGVQSRKQLVLGGDTTNTPAESLGSKLSDIGANGAVSGEFEKTQQQQCFWVPFEEDDEEVLQEEEEEEEEEAGSRAAMQELRMALCLNVANVNDGRAKALDPRRPAVTVIVNHAAMAKKTADASSRAPSSSSRRERDCGEPAHEPGS